MSNEEDNSSDTKENQCPTPTLSKSLGQSLFENTPPSSLSSALKTKNFTDVCIPEKDLPSKVISELWQKPLKIPTLLNVNSPKGRTSQRKTPTRRSILPPTKLVFDHYSDSEESPAEKVKQTRGCRRSLSMPTDSTCGNENLHSNPKRLKLFVDETSPFEDIAGDNKKRASHGVVPGSSSTLTPAVKKLFLKSQSDSVLESCSIKKAVEKIDRDPSLIGDGTKSYILPFISNGKHPDLKEIDCATLAELFKSKEAGSLSFNFKVIDCRYPYEFEGGHIKGALNLYTKKLIQEQLLDPKTILQSPSSNPKKSSEAQEREILIFHCEFSSRRGPFLCRYLRDSDRAYNLTSYPFLFYPELYVLYGGYKDFFNEFPSLCEPQEYLRMDDPSQTENYRKFKSEAKLKI